SKRAALEEERKSLREEAEKAEGLGQALAHEKAVVETSRKVLEEESLEVEGRRKALEELQEARRREVDAGREELRLAAGELEKKKGDIKAAWKAFEDDRLKAEAALERSRNVLEGEKAEVKRARGDLGRFSARVSPATD
ncbi:unnamed protein product, partial [Ectocarpus sp. 8 AP-2014]